MSAPDGKYSTEYLKVNRNGTNYRWIRQALALTEYTDNAHFKQYFKVDKVQHRTTSGNEKVVIGLLNANGTNLRYHADARKAKARLVVNGTTYIPLNDSGLNTKAEASVNQVIIAYSNYIKIDCAVFSAYYLKTDSVKVTAYNNTTQQTLFSNVVVATNIPAQTSADSMYFIVRESAQAAAGDIITLTITATNGEGDLSTTYGNVVCQGMLDDIVFWQMLSTQDQNPTTGTQYVVVPTVDQWNFITNTLLLQSASNWNATNEHDVGTPIKGVQGNDFSESALTNTLPAGHYYVVSGLSNAVILLVDSNGKAFGWCNSTYSPPTPVVNPLNDVSVVISARYTMDINTGSVSLTDMYITLDNANAESMSIEVSVVMTDGASEVSVGDVTIPVGAGETEGDYILDSNKDNPVGYTSLSNEPTAKVTLIYGQYTRVIEDVPVPNNL